MSQDAPPPGQPLTRQEEIARLNAALREEFGPFFDDLEAMLHRHDPVGTGSPHRDEYRPEMCAMLPRIAACTSAADVRAMTHEVFVRFFNPSIAGPEERFTEIATEIWALWTSEASRAYRSTPPSP